MGGGAVGIRKGRQASRKVVPVEDTYWQKLW